MSYQFRILAEVLVCLSFFGSEGFAAASGNAGETIKVGSSPVVSSAGIYLAEAAGYFREQGINVEIIDVAASGAPMTVMLASDGLDVAAGNLTAGLFSAIAGGQGFRLVADKGHIDKEADYINLLVRADHLASGRYKTPKDLKGFKLGLTALDGVSQQILGEKFLALGALKESDIEYVKLSYAEMNTALKTKSLDAAVQLEPFVAQAELGGYAKVVLRGAAVYPGQQSAALIYSAKFLKNREVAVKFMVAYLKGVRDFNRSLKDGKSTAAVEQLKKRLKIEDAVWTKMAPVGLRSDGALNVESLSADLAWYEKKGFLKKMLKAQDTVELTIAKEAAKRLDGR